VKPEKCKWKVREVEFLGVVIGPKGVEMQKEKVEGVLNWPASRNVKEVQKFLGLANYYRRFIKDFARIAVLLHMLVRKEQKWKWRPVAFISKSLNTTEQNYEIHDKEMLAVIRCLEAWKHYLERAKLEFEIWTDYKNLQYFMTSQKLNHRQARWVLYLL